MLSKFSKFVKSVTSSEYTPNTAVISCQFKLGEPTPSEGLEPILIFKSYVLWYLLETYNTGTPSSSL